MKKQELAGREPRADALASRLADREGGDCVPEAGVTATITPVAIMTAPATAFQAGRRVFVRAQRDELLISYFALGGQPSFSPAPPAV